MEEGNSFDFDAFLSRLAPPAEPIPVDLAGQVFRVRPLADAGEVARIERSAFNRAQHLKDDNAPLPPQWAAFREAEPEIIEAVTWCIETVKEPKLNDLQWFRLAASTPLFYDFAKTVKAAAYGRAAVEFADVVEAEGEG